MRYPPVSPCRALEKVLPLDYLTPGWRTVRCRPWPPGMPRRPGRPPAGRTRGQRGWAMSIGGIRAGVLGVVIAVGVALPAVLLSACGGAGLVGSGTAATQARHVAAFSRVELAGSSDVTIQAGAAQSVVVHADDNLLGQVTTRVRAGTLVIGTKGSFTTSSPMTVEIGVPSLEALAISGSGALTASNIQGPRVSVRLAGSGAVRASGTVTRLDVWVGGSGDAQLG